jgi:hypothetical protein
MDGCESEFRSLEMPEKCGVKQKYETLKYLAQELLPE